MKNNELAETAKKSLQKQQTEKTTLSVVKKLLNTDEVTRRFQEVLGKNANAFVASLVSVVSSNTKFEKIDPNSIIAAGLIAATFNLPINPNLGFAYIIPYGGKTNKAQFQLGYKGIIQLAERTNIYKTINVCPVCEGELISWNKFTGVAVFDESKKKSDKIKGYYAYFELSGGFKKELYLTTEELIAHGKKYSKSFKEGLWTSDAGAMCRKTIIKMILSGWGILSVDMQRAQQADQATIKLDESGEFVYDYVDNPASPESEEVNFVEKPVDKPEDKKPDGKKVEEDPRYSSSEFYIENLEGCTSIKQADDFAKYHSERIESLSKEEAKKVNDYYMLVCKKLKKNMVI